MRNVTTLVLALAVAAGCGKSDKKGEGGDNAKTASGKPAKGGDPSAMITGTVPTLPPEVAAAKFGAVEADVHKALGVDSGFVPSKTNSDITYDLDFTNDKKLEKVSMRAKVDLEPILTKAWGPPIKTEKEKFWFNPAASMRAYLPDYGKNEVVAFDAYEPLEKLLGDKGNAFAMANGKSVLGMTVDEFKAAMGDKLCKFDEEGTELKKDLAEAEKDLLASMRDAKRTIHICFDNPRTVQMFNSLGDDARFGYDGKLSSIYISLQAGKSAELIKQTAALLDKTYGGNPVVIETDNGKDNWYFDPANKTQVRVSLGADWMGIEYGSLFPVAELIGGDKPGLSVEGAHMPVGTFEQIKADDPTHYAQRGESAFLYYPPTEFNFGQTEVDLQIYAHEKKTYAYRTVIHHTKNPAQGDKVLELLKAKFGEPKKDKKSTDKDEFWNFSKNGRKVEARRVSDQWQINVTK